MNMAGQQALSETYLIVLNQSAFSYWLFTKDSLCIIPIPDKCWLILKSIFQTLKRQTDFLFSSDPTCATLFSWHQAYFLSGFPNHFVVQFVCHYYQYTVSGLFCLFWQGEFGALGSALQTIQIKSNAVRFKKTEIENRDGDQLAK